MIFSFLSMLVLLLLSRILPLNRLTSEWAPIFLIGGMIFFGGVVGLFVGFVTAQKTNQWLGWNQTSQPGSFATKSEL
jgi:hypothetical protein